MWLPLTPPHRSWNCSWTEERTGLLGPSHASSSGSPGQPTGGRENPVESGSGPHGLRWENTPQESSNESIARTAIFQPPEPPGIRFLNSGNRRAAFSIQRGKRGHVSFRPFGVFHNATQEKK